MKRAPGSEDVFQSELVNLLSISDRDLSDKLCSSVILSRSDFNNVYIFYKKILYIVQLFQIKKCSKPQRASRGSVATKAPYF